jgi:single-stranded DNA-binding protein
VKYLHKGSRLAVQGHIDTSTYVKDGKQVTDWSVRVDPFGTMFLDSKPAGGDGAAREQTLAELMQSGADLGEGVTVGADDIPF